MDEPKEAWVIEESVTNHGVDRWMIVDVFETAVEASENLLDLRDHRYYRVRRYVPAEE